ncbi:acetate--CoA ligase [Nocardia sp. CA2R105]|uniref:acetate--CoA ligase n=1 Tax=Nocardia coffeae TaxID=2873381 RepID=UPI001CA6CAE6|nr:acetate--CoA ligase [Nocardia coffeae]MBY8862413.1 acetate--CoA ligase [Nocardia coffeae]
MDDQVNHLTPAHPAHGNDSGAELYARAEADRKAFWAAQARRLHWDEPWQHVLDWSRPPIARWFDGGRLNVAYNCVDRHVEAGYGDQVAVHWVGEPGDTRDITYRDLHRMVQQAANALAGLGLRAGDRVAIQLPMIPEAIVAMLACARLGLVHSVVFAGFSPAALRARVDDARARVVVTADGQYRRGRAVPMKEKVDEALVDADSVERVIVVRRVGADLDDDTPWQNGRDIWWHDLLRDASDHHDAESFDAEHPLFILYTSGTTGKPKGILHTSGGYLTQAAYTHRIVFDHRPGSDVYWCTADIGWITGHTYLVYGPLANRTTQVVYEGTPNVPHEGRHWEIIQRYRVSLYYTAPTLIRTFMKWGEQIPARYDLSSLRVLGSVGEPINPEAWLWYHQHVGGGRSPIVDTWWQTETGAIMVAPLPGLRAPKPGAAQRPLPGIGAKVVDDEGRQVSPGASGYLVIDSPWPAMARGIWGDDERFRTTYWDRFAAHDDYFAGDGARYDTDGDIWILGRTDDVMNVSGHRLSTAEIESALVAHPAVAEAAVVGASDALTGQRVIGFVVARGEADPPTADDLRRYVAEAIGPIATPREIHSVPELPKTRSGKIVRRLLRDIADGREPSETTTLADPAVITDIAQRFGPRTDA